MADTTPTTLAAQQAAIAKSAEEQRKVQATAKETAAAGVDARLEAKAKQVAENQERHDNLQPTPTQRECDLARVGALDLDNKEDDGSEWQSEHDARVHTEKMNNPYAEATATAAERPARRSASRKK